MRFLAKDKSSQQLLQRLADLLLRRLDALRGVDHGETLRELGRAAPAGEGMEVLGPAPAPLALLRGRHRRRLLLKARRDIGVQRLLGEWLARVDVPGNVRVQVDVDPEGFL